jgi:hypothetical protein
MREKYVPYSIYLLVGKNALVFLPIFRVAVMAHAASKITAEYWIEPDK